VDYSLFKKIKEIIAEVVGSVGNSERVFQAACGKIYDFSKEAALSTTLSLLSFKRMSHN